MHVHMHTFEPVHMLMTSRIFQVTYFTVYAPILTPLAGVAWHASIGFPKDTSNYEVAMVISGCVVIMLYTAIWICLMWVTKAYICHGSLLRCFPVKTAQMCLWPGAVLQIVWAWIMIKAFPCQNCTELPMVGYCASDSHPK